MKNILTKKKQKCLFIFEQNKIKVRAFSCVKKLCCNKYRKYKYRMTISKDIGTILLTHED